MEECLKFMKDYLESFGLKKKGNSINDGRQGKDRQIDYDEMYKRKSKKKRQG